MILVAVLFLLPSTFTYINPGNVGIVIHRAGGGVDPHPLGPGVHMRVPFATGIEEYPVFLQTVVLTRANNEGSGANDEINVNSVEGQPVSLDVSLSFELDPAQTPKLYSTFRTDIDEITHGFVKQTIRQALQEVVRHRAGGGHHRSEEGRGHQPGESAASRSGCSPTASR